MHQNLLFLFKTKISSKKSERTTIKQTLVRNYTWGREGKGREGKGRKGKGREGKHTVYIEDSLCLLSKEEPVYFRSKAEEESLFKEKKRP